MASLTPSSDSEGRDIVPNFINGQAIILPGNASFPVTSSKQHKVIHHGQSATVAIARHAVDHAATAFKTYKKTSVQERRAKLLRFAELLEAKADAFTKVQVAETSCEIQWAAHGVMGAALFVREVAVAIAEAVAGELPSSAFGFTSLVYKEPVGPVLIIPPWNSAVTLAARSMASILAAGCTVVLKASELCPATHKLIVDTLHEAGFPSGAVNLVMADRSAAAEVTEAIISHPALRKVEFIGSAGVGRIIASLAAKHFKPVLLELGDQSPAIILDDADLPNAAQLCAQGTVMHHGQICFGTERIIVQSSVMEKFAQLLVEAFKDVPPPGTSITAAGAEKAKNVIDEAIKDGAKLLCGSAEMTSSASISPSILTDVKRDSAISTGEAFAPTAFIVPVDTEEEAIEEANSRIGGLSASVFTSSFERGLRIARELEFGGVQINNMTFFAEPAGPTSGHKGSGWGSNNGKYGIQEFLRNKLVSLVPTTPKPAA